MSSESNGYAIYTNGLNREILGEVGDCPEPCGYAISAEPAALPEAASRAVGRHRGESPLEGAAPLQREYCSGEAASVNTNTGPTHQHSSLNSDD